MPEPLDPLIKVTRECERLKVANADLRSLNKKLLRRGGGYDAFLEALQHVLDTDKHFAFKPSLDINLISPVDSKHEEIACVAVSDLHLAETVNKDEVLGLNSYNSIIAANRLWEHAQKLKSILSRHMLVYSFKQIWSPLLGDMISGSIHPEMLISNDLPDPAAVILASRLLYMFYQELKTLGLPIEIDTAVGNHPRTSIKMPTKKQAATNLDWLLYEILADRFKGDDQISMNVQTSQIGMKMLYGWRYVWEHGTGLKSGKEEDTEERIRSMFDDTIFREATGLKGASFDQIVTGHTHRMKFLERQVVNGCYTGANELGLVWRLSPVRSGQALWGVSKKHPRTFQYGIDLTHILSEKSENPMSEYARYFLRKHRK